MLSVHAPPPTTNACVPFQWFSWIYSDWFSTFRLSLITHVSFGRHHFLHWWINNFRQHNHFNYSSGNKVGALFNSYPLRRDLFSPPIQFFIGFSMLIQFFTIHLSLTLCWLENRAAHHAQISPIVQSIVVQGALGGIDSDAMYKPTSKSWRLLYLSMLTHH